MKKRITNSSDQPAADRNHVRGRDIEFAVIGQTILWEDTEFADQWSVLSLLDNAATRASKDGSGYCSAYPAMHLVPA